MNVINRHTQFHNDFKQPKSILKEELIFDQC